MGLGRRTFAPGEVLTASNVMNYLMDQSVMNFAGTAARGSAIGTAVQEGMVTYLNDSNLLEAYDGSSWKQLASTTGSVLQVLSTTKTDTFSTSATTTWTDITGVSLTITPKSTSSKILITAILQHGWSATNPTYFRAVRDSTAIGTAANSGAFFGYESAVTNSNSTFATTQIAFNFLDSPNTTSATTYKIQVFNVSAGTSWFGRRPADNSVGGIQSLTLIEVAG